MEKLDNIVMYSPKDVSKILTHHENHRPYIHESALSQTKVISNQCTYINNLTNLIKSLPYFLKLSKIYKNS